MPSVVSILVIYILSCFEIKLIRMHVRIFKTICLEYALLAVQLFVVQCY